MILLPSAIGQCVVHVHMISDTLPPLLSLRGALVPKQSPHLTLSLRGSSAAVAIWWGEIATSSARNDKIGLARNDKSEKGMTISTLPLRCAKGFGSPQ